MLCLHFMLIYNTLLGLLWATNTPFTRSGSSSWFACEGNTFTSQIQAKSTTGVSQHFILVVFSVPLLSLFLPLYSFNLQCEGREWAHAVPHLSSPINENKSN